MEIGDWLVKEMMGINKKDIWMLKKGRGAPCPSALIIKIN